MVEPFRRSELGECAGFQVVAQWRRITLAASFPHMTRSLGKQNVDVEFMRLLFTDAVEEQIAYRWASRFAALFGPWVLQLRPQSTLAEMIEWAAIAEVDTMDFALVFEPELRMDLAEF